MKLFEFNAKSIFKQNGIPIPEGYVAKSSNDAKDIAKTLALEWGESKKALYAEVLEMLK